MLGHENTWSYVRAIGTTPGTSRPAACDALSRSAADVLSVDGSIADGPDPVIAVEILMVWIPVSRVMDCGQLLWVLSSIAPCNLIAGNHAH